MCAGVELCITDCTCCMTCLYMHAAVMNDGPVRCLCDNLMPRVLHVHIMHNNNYYVIHCINYKTTLSVIRCSNPKSMTTLYGLASHDDILVNTFFFDGGGAEYDCMKQS